MRHLLLSVFLRHPIQHPASPVIIEIDVNIRQRDTVGIQETFKQQVILNRVNLSDTQAVSYRRTCRRATSGSHGHVQLFTSRTDKVLYNQEVARETHRLHDMKLELDALTRFFIQDLAITSMRTFQG